MTYHVRSLLLSLAAVAAVAAVAGCGSSQDTHQQNNPSGTTQDTRDMDLTDEDASFTDQGGSPKQDMRQVAQEDASMLQAEMALVSDMTSCATPEPLGEPVPGRLVLGAAGAPVSLFGPVDNPTYDEAFDEVLRAGFDTYMPLFITSEFDAVAQDTKHMHAFLPEEFVGKSAPTCQEIKPYAKLKKKGLNVLFPGFLFAATSPPVSQPVDETKFREALSLVREQCWGEDENIITGIQNYDEPVLNHMSALIQNKPAFDLANVPKTYAILKQEFPTTPIVTVEGPLPLVLSKEPLSAQDRKALDDMFWDKSKAIGNAADWYGFDVYPVPLFELADPGRYVREVKARWPKQNIISVLQGFSLTRQTSGRIQGDAPTKSQTRFMAYDSIVSGSRMLFWWGQSVLDLKTYPEDAKFWKELGTVVLEVKQVSAMLNFPETTLAGFPSGTALGHLATKGPDGTTYAILVNRSDERVSWVIPGEEQVFELLSLAPRSRTVDIEPYGVALIALKGC